MATLSSFDAITNGPVATLRSRPGDVIELRRLYEQLGEVDSVHDRHRHASMLVSVHRHMVEEILRIFVEDDIIQAGSVIPVVRSLVESWELGRDLIPNGKAGAPPGAWFEQQLTFWEMLADAAELRRPRRYITYDDVQFIAAPSAAQLLGFPDPPSGEDTNDPTYRIFPDVDATLADPIQGPKLAEWYAQAIMRVQGRLQAKDVRASVLCFVEKSFSVVGAITTKSQLVTSAQMPAVIYRTAYPRAEDRFGGTVPEDGATVILVYDVFIHGSILQEVSRVLRDRFGATVVGAVVLYDFEPTTAVPSPWRTSTEIEAKLRRSTLDRSRLTTMLERPHRWDASRSSAPSGREQNGVGQPREPAINYPISIGASAAAGTSTMMRADFMRSFADEIAQSQRRLDERGLSRASLRAAAAAPRQGFRAAFRQEFQGDIAEGLAELDKRTS